MDKHRQSLNKLNGRKIGSVEISNGANPSVRFLSKTGKLMFTVGIYQVFDEKGFRMGWEDVPIQDDRT